MSLEQRPQKVRAEIPAAFLKSSILIAVLMPVPCTAQGALAEFAE